MIIRYLLFIFLLFTYSDSIAQATTIYINTTQNELLRYEPNLCTSEFVVEFLPIESLVIQDPADIAFTPNGQLYGVIEKSIVKIDTITGENGKNL